MNIFKTLSTSMLILLCVCLQAQTKKNSEYKNEIKEKTYTFEKDGIAYENSVKVSTSVTQAVMMDTEDKGKVNGERIFPPKVVIKEVWIDNDKDFEYDEYVKFSYLSDAEEDFTLVATPENLVVAVEDGEKTSIIQNMSILKEQGAQNKDAYVFTMENGNTLELKVEAYKKLSNEQTK